MEGKGGREGDEAGRSRGKFADDRAESDKDKLKGSS